MKKLQLTFLILTIPAILTAQTGIVMDNLSMTSKILKMDRKYAIYLPPDYDSSQRSYPVLYLLHGAGDDQTGWVQFGEILHIADKAINQGTATPMIVVMPDANTGKRGYVNDVKGEWGYEDFFFQEFMPFIEKTYRIKGDKKYSVLSLIENIPDIQKRAVRWYIDCGDDDFLFEGNSLVHIAMRKKEIPHEFRIRDGGHSWTYWRTSLPTVLEFVSMSFHQF